MSPSMHWEIFIGLRLSGPNSNMYASKRRQQILLPHFTRNNKEFAEYAVMQLHDSEIGTATESEAVHLAHRTGWWGAGYQWMLMRFNQMENPRPACDLHSPRTKNKVAPSIDTSLFIPRLFFFFYSPPDSIKCLMLSLNTFWSEKWMT